MNDNNDSDKIFQKRTNINAQLQQNIDSYEKIFEILASENIEESLKRKKPDLPDFTHDINGSEIQYEKSITRKPMGCKLALTKEHVEELVYCYYHPIYTIRNYIKILNNDGGIMYFDMYPYQLRYIQKCFGNKKVISKWARQSGKCEKANTFIHLAKKPTKWYKKIIYKILIKICPELFNNINFID